MSMPVQKPGKSKQDYATPWAFVEQTLCLLNLDFFTHDFAADETNFKSAQTFWTQQDNSLSKTPAQWVAACDSGWGWLNPPFSRIGPWAKRCMETKDLGGSIAFLVPAGVGSNWFRDYVNHHAFVWALNGRIAFDPEHPTWGYPKDCILCLFSPQIDPGFDVWTWA